MPIIRAKKDDPAGGPSWFIGGYSPREPIPEDCHIRGYGLITMKAGEECDLHYHDCDEWWMIVGGRARVVCGDEEGEVGAGDMVFTRMGESHQISGVTDVTFLWFAGPLRGEKRAGHLHDEE